MTRPSALRSRSIFVTVVSYLGDCCAQSVVKVRLAVRSSDCSRILMLSRRVLCVHVMPRTLILHDWFVLRYYDGAHTFCCRCHHVDLLLLSLRVHRRVSPSSRGEVALLVRIRL